MSRYFIPCLVGFMAATLSSILEDWGINTWQFWVIFVFVFVAYVAGRVQESLFSVGK